MSNLFIRIKDGSPFEHPITEENFKLAFPEIDVNNLPSNFMRFERLQKPLVGPYQFVEENVYVIEGDICKDFWEVRPMTQEEKLDKQESVKATKPYPSWLFDEENCINVPPVPKPEGKYTWRESDTSWVYIPPHPGGEVKLNIETGTESAEWVPI